MRKPANLSLPKLFFVVATRATLGAGIGLLASAGLPKRSRQRLGKSLLTIGALTTLPALWFVFGGQERGEPEYSGAGGGSAAAVS
jgi:hypothetical protein